MASRRLVAHEKRARENNTKSDGDNLLLEHLFFKFVQKKSIMPEKFKQTHLNGLEILRNLASVILIIKYIQ